MTEKNEAEGIVDNENAAETKDIAEVSKKLNNIDLNDYKAVNDYIQQLTKANKQQRDESLEDAAYKFSLLCNELDFEVDPVELVKFVKGELTASKNKKTAITDTTKRPYTKNTVKNFRKPTGEDWTGSGNWSSLKEIIKQNGFTKEDLRIGKGNKTNFENALKQGDSKAQTVIQELKNKAGKGKETK